MQSGQSVIQCLEKNWNKHLDDLKALVRVPSISFPGYPPENVTKSAEAVSKLMQRAGLKNVEVIKLGSAHPYVYGEWLEAKDAPTLLLYAHHDVQPVGREDVWKTPPFEPTEKEGPGGMRLFGRGAADDKAGVIVHLSAIESFLKTNGKLPVNVKMIVEGEEEVGSSELENFLKTYRSRLDADVLVLTDTSNFEIGIPSLTVALRGIVAMSVELRSLKKTVHSGMWGGPLPDPVMALTKVLAGMTDSDGRVTIPGALDGFRPPTEQELSEAAKLPYNEKQFRDQGGMVESAKILKQGSHPLAQTWMYPSVTVNAFEASSRKSAANIICDAAWARVTLRCARGMNPKKTFEAMARYIKEATPWGLEVSITDEGGGNPWATDPVGPAFECAKRALEKGYGHRVVAIGSGGTIPFVEPFAKALGGAPVLLVGVEDPYTNAHGENESLLISDFKKACLSQVYLFDEIGSNYR